MATTTPRMKITYATLSADNEELQSAFDAAVERVRGELGRSYPMLIGAEERRGATEFEDRSPIDSQIVVSRFPVGTRQDVRDSLLGPGIRFDGLVSVPGGSEGNLQVVIHLYSDSGGRPGHFIRAASPRFAVGRARAATGTSPFPLVQAGPTNRAWVAFLPYSALDLSAETAGPVRIIAEPVLYVDRFGVKAGRISPITCRCGR